MKTKSMVRYREWWTTLDPRFEQVIWDVENLREEINLRQISLYDIKFVLLGYIKEEADIIDRGRESDYAGFYEWFGLGSELMKIIFRIERGLIQ